MWQCSTTQGYLYILHFSAPLGNPEHPKGMARHYVGFAEDVDARIAQHLSGRGAAITAAAVRKGVTFTVYHWPAQKAAERLVKRSGHADRYCPACAEAAHRAVKPLPSPPAAQLTFDLEALEALPEVTPLPISWAEYQALREWRAARVRPVTEADLARLDDLL